MEIVLILRIISQTQLFLATLASIAGLAAPVPAAATTEELRERDGYQPDSEPNYVVENWQLDCNEMTAACADEISCLAGGTLNIVGLENMVCVRNCRCNGPAALPL
ncbi:hypothetical protein F5Y19DRAFT_473568 [Xylariaceae sp. FL1651]|nr:hypothetical protein F5Y19DRAFT_473568 [Xylariaceae sp. FL1651]